jgi:hypothetical protein
MNLKNNNKDAARDAGQIKVTNLIGDLSDALERAKIVGAIETAVRDLDKAIGNIRNAENMVRFAQSEVWPRVHLNLQPEYETCERFWKELRDMQVRLFKLNDQIDPRAGFGIPAKEGSVVKGTSHQGQPA